MSETVYGFDRNGCTEWLGIRSVSYVGKSPSDTLQGPRFAGVVPRVSFQSAHAYCIKQHRGEKGICELGLLHASRN